MNFNILYIFLIILLLYYICFVPKNTISNFIDTNGIGGVVASPGASRYVHITNMYEPAQAPTAYPLSENIIA